DGHPGHGSLVGRAPSAGVRPLRWGGAGQGNTARVPDRRRAV
ncbi:MAG: hypothetical protein AVDCRST_MAG12-467, partial [uncultured Rubrobacteraceae bacterium]